jgi:hypothetical protein
LTRLLAGDKEREFVERFVGGKAVAWEFQGPRAFAQVQTLIGDEAARPEVQL